MKTVQSRRRQAQSPRRGQTQTNRSFGSQRPRSSGGKRRGVAKQPSFNPSQFINTAPVPVAREEYIPRHTFADFKLDMRIMDALLIAGITQPTPIQDQIIPEILEGSDVVGIAETGTGKTAAFLLPLIQKTIKDKKRQTLILAPTRELALQIQKEVNNLSQGLDIFSTICVGGMNINPQIRSFKRKNHFIIGTPGRVLDLVRRKCINLPSITTVVLDEADRMLDMGFVHDMRKILSDIPSRETLFFSATMDASTEVLVKEFLKNPVTVSVKKQDVAKSIKQDVVHYTHDQKFETLVELLSDREFAKVIIFGSMKHSVAKLAQQLNHSGIRSESIHGNKSHNQRKYALEQFKKDVAQVLVATDVAARGIHIDGVTHVINYDLPSTFEDYVHRIGRTGRGDKHGKALTFILSR